LIDTGGFSLDDALVEKVVSGLENWFKSDKPFLLFQFDGRFTKVRLEKVENNE
jgi:hypothetical protein